MNELVKKIFIESGHAEEQFRNKLLYYSFKEMAYYFVIDLEQVEFEKIRNYSDFEQLEKHKKLKENYEKLEREGKSNTIEKNSSLIVLVKCDSLRALEKYQQQILLLEEDEYFFKKYVVLYSHESIKDLKDIYKLIPVLQEKVKDKTKFDSYGNNGFQVELEEYLLILQLYIKFPFLKLPFEGDAFQSLASKISGVLGTVHEELYDQLTEKSDRILKIDFESEDDKIEIDEILKLLPDD